MNTIRKIIFALLTVALMTTYMPVNAQTVETSPEWLNQVNEAAAPDDGEIVLSEDALQELKMLDSVTDEQLQAIDKVIEKYTPELDAIDAQSSNSTISTLPNQIFLPVASNGPNTENRLSGDTNVVESASTNSVTVEKATTQMENVLQKIDQEVAAILTPEQRVLFESLSSLEESTMVSASAVSVTSNCYWGARYAGTGYIYAKSARYYGYWDWKRVNRTYSYRNYYYNLYSRDYAYTGLQQAGGAYGIAVAGYAPSNSSLDENAVSNLSTARNRAYWGRYYAWRSWKNTGSTNYGRLAYYRANTAYAYLGYAINQMKNC
ncbi:MAG: hypothetical protein KDE47_08810 [Caldilineaceae bacterium]|nr:hypothetical protein [Caldilineaceae bacterium]